MTDPTLPLAFAAGVVSFLSPCVLPIVPGYLSYMSGMTGGEQPGTRQLPAWAVAITFVIGFSVVFIALGATATLLGSLLRENQRLLARVGGAVIIVLGLVFMGALKIPLFYREARFHPTPGAGLWGSAVLGAAFAFGWSPCIGATLGAVLAMAAGRGASGGPAEGALLLAAYSLGLGIPFLIAGLGVSRLTGAVRWLRQHTRTVNLVSGALLVVVGLLLVTDQFFRLSIWFQKNFPASF
ncbi:MAG TPA: cytochrome c biogenesis CcdA family protein [Actinomycetota bacterium]|nr:cytochrome c biogenesis CcdA family protein [Actinomycetota bacterium]